MIPLLYISAVLSMAAQSALNKLGGRAGAKTFRFNFYKAFCAFLLFFIAALITEELHIPTVIYGLSYGASLTVSMYCGYKALNIGPLSLTSMLASFSLVIPVLYGALILKESISIFAYFGFAFLFCALILLNVKKKKDDAKPSLLWAICVLATVVTNGICSVIQKSQQSAFPGEYRFNFMASAMLVSTLAFAFIALCKKELIALPKKPELIGGIAGILNGLSNFFTLWLTMSSPASILFPLISVCTMLCSLLSGKLIFKEKLSKCQMIGFFVGVLSVFLLNQ